MGVGHFLSHRRGVHRARHPDLHPDPLEADVGEGAGVGLGGQKILDGFGGDTGAGDGCGQGDDGGGREVGRDGPGVAAVARAAAGVLAAGLLQEPDPLDAHPPVHRLAHVVNGEGCHRHRCQRLHLHPGLTRYLTGGIDMDTGTGPVDSEFNRHRGQHQRVTQGDQVRRFFCGLDTRHPRHRQRLAHRHRNQSDKEPQGQHHGHHTGQHILSQAFIELANAATVGFHMSPDSITIDLDKPSVTPVMVDAVEDLANYMSDILFRRKP